MYKTVSTTKSMVVDGITQTITTQTKTWYPDTPQPDPMDKIKFRTIQRAWQKFDRLTALGCAQKKIPYDPLKCREAWNQYNQVLASYDILPFPPL